MPGRVHDSGAELEGPIRVNHENCRVLVGDGNQQDQQAIVLLVARLGATAEAVATGAEALAAVQRERPPLVVLDVELTEPSAYEVCRELREQFGEELSIVFVSAKRTDPNDEIAALLLGADDYYAKPLNAELFVARMRRLLARIGARDPSRPLTKREREVLQLLVGGRRPAEIAQQLYITPKTAATHIEHILAKLGAHSQAQAVAFAVRDGIIDARNGIAV